jgi:hypothetical protein
LAVGIDLSRMEHYSSARRTLTWSHSLIPSVLKSGAAIMFNIFRKFPALYKSENFFAVFIRICYRILPTARWIQSITSHSIIGEGGFHTFLESVLISRKCFFSIHDFWLEIRPLNSNKLLLFPQYAGHSLPFINPWTQDLHICITVIEYWRYYVGGRFKCKTNTNLELSLNSLS